MRKIKIAPSVMCADFLHIKSDLKKLEKCGASLFHFDIMDGVFVPNIAIGADTVRAVRKITKIPLDAHLMVCRPERYLEQFASAGSDIICVHAEATKHLDRALQSIRDLGAVPAVALNPSTPVNLLKYVTGKFDMALIMSVNPGFAGQAFIPATVQKVRELRQMLEEREACGVEIEVDGCINDNTIGMLIKAGANVFVGGTAGVFVKGRDPAVELKKRLENAEGSLKSMLEKADERLVRWWKN